MPRARVPNVANNRHDLLTPAAPGRMMVTPGQRQGQESGQMQSMRMQPIGVPEQPPGATPAAVPPGAGAPAPQLPPAQQGPMPGELPWLDHPGSGGPPTTGLPNSAGPGPEVLTGLGAQWWANKNSEQGTLQSVLTHLASQPNASSVIKSLASAAGT